MEILQLLAKEFTEEYHTTKKFIHNYPEGKNAYAPHEKSTKMQPLTEHIVDIFQWPALILDTAYIDFADGGDRKPAPEDKAGFVKMLDSNFQKGLAAIEQANDEKLEERWQLRLSGQILADWSKYESLRHVLNQVTHHRAQLGTYYRLLEIAVPSSYGPSADEATF